MNWLLAIVISYIYIFFVYLPDSESSHVDVVGGAATRLSASSSSSSDTDTTSSSSSSSSSDSSDSENGNNLTLIIYENNIFQLWAFLKDDTKCY